MDSYDSERGKSLAKNEDQIRDTAIKSQDALNTIGALRQLVNSGAMTQGPGSASWRMLNRMGEMMGIPSQNLSNAQIFSAIANKMALENRSNMPGAMSDSDREFLVGMGPSLANNKDANNLLLNYAERVNKRNLDVARMAERYRSNNGGRIDDRFYALLHDWSLQNPMFGKDDHDTLAKSRSETGKGVPSGWSVSARPAPAQQAGAP